MRPQTKILIGFLIYLLCICIFAEVYAKNTADILRIAHYEHRRYFGVMAEVTSVNRSTEHQAQLLYSAYSRGVDLYKLYENKKLVDEIMFAIDDVPSIITVLDKQVKRGDYISKHLCGKAVDIRSKHLSPQTRRRFAAYLNNKYWNTLEVINELKPPHFHLELKEGCNYG